MEISNFGISKGKIKLFLLYLLVLGDFVPANSQFLRRHRYRLIPTADSDELLEYSSSTSTSTPSPTVKHGIRINSYREILDPETGLVLTWSVNRNLETISLTIESNKKSGYVALALMKYGEGQLKKGADVVVVGVRRADGVPYVVDMYGKDNEDVEQDDSQDWRLDLDDSISDDGGMRISIRRDLNTCDDQDLPIGSERLSIAYDQGSQDIPSQIRPKGIKDIAFVAPSSTPIPSNCPEDSISHRTSPISTATDSSSNLRTIHTSNPLEDLTDSSSTLQPRAGSDSGERLTELENRSEYQDPADDRYGYAHVKIHPFFHSLAYARLKWKFMLSKLKFNKYFKSIKFKYV